MGGTLNVGVPPLFKGITMNTTLTKDNPASTGISDGDAQREGTARAIHKAYCKHFAKVGYDAFRDCWLRAATVVMMLECDPARFVEAQKTRRTDLDPEDLSAQDSFDCYCRVDRDLAKEMIESFEGSEKYLISLTAHNPCWVPETALYPLAMAFQSAFRVVYSKVNFTPEIASRIIQLHSSCAAEELRSSKRFIRYIQHRYPKLDIDAFLGELDHAAEASVPQAGAQP